MADSCCYVDIKQCISENIKKQKKIDFKNGV